jgi:RNA polymerase sigma factor (sigma-70 family)
MTTGQLSGVAQHLRRAVLLRDEAGLTDGQLLENYISRRDEAALAVLVQRHGPMVWGVCRRVLSNYHDAEDAFQATFLVFVRRAASIASRELLANWLYGVAHQTALKARATAAKRTVRERQATDMPEPAAVGHDCWNDLRPVLDEELSRLPNISRIVIVLCDLEGKTRQEAARHLGVPEGTVGSRLARARALLAKRLTDRGVALSGGALATVLAQNASAAGVPDAVVTSTLRAASCFAAGQGEISPGALALTNQVMNGMIMSKLKLLCAGLLAVTLLGFGLARENSRAPTASAQPTPAPAKVQPKPDAPWQDLLPLIDPDKHTIGKGIWRLKDGKLTGYPAAHGARLRVPVVPGGDYELRARWEPKSADSSVAFIVPHGDRMASIDVMTAWNLAGLGDLNGVRPNVNETKTEVRIKPGNVYDVAIRVSFNDTTVHVVARLDKQEIVNWKGKRSELEHEFFAPPKPASLGLGVGGDASIFHRLELRMLSGKANPWKPADTPEDDKEAFTAWGKEEGGLQAGLGFRPGERRAYHHGETVPLVVRIRNVSKNKVRFDYHSEFLRETAPAVTDAKDNAVPLAWLTFPGGARGLGQVDLAPGKEIELYEFKLELKPASEQANKMLRTLYGTGAFYVQYKRVDRDRAGAELHYLDELILSKLATGKLELEVKADPPPKKQATRGEEPPKTDPPKPEERPKTADPPRTDKPVPEEEVKRLKLVEVYTNRTSYTTRPTPQAPLPPVIRFYWGKKNEVRVAPGGSALVEMPGRVREVTWQIPGYVPEGAGNADDGPEFDYVYCKWDKDGKVTFTMYKKP